MKRQEIESTELDAITEKAKDFEKPKRKRLGTVVDEATHFSLTTKSKLIDRTVKDSGNVMCRLIEMYVAYDESMEEIEGLLAEHFKPAKNLKKLEETLEKSTREPKRRRNTSM